MKRRILTFVLALSMVLSLAACAGGSKAPESTPSPTEAPAATAMPAPTEAPAEPTEEPAPTAFTFTDSCGREVEIPAEISRIAASGPLTQIILFAIAPDLFVGLAAKWGDCAKGMIPEEYFELPYFGQLYGSANLSVEELALADPQLIIDVGEAKKTIVEDMDALQELTTIPSVHIEANLETMPQAYRTLGALLGREEQAEKLAAFCEKTYARTKNIMEAVGENRVNALYVLGEEGLNVLANGSYHAELIDMLTNNLAVVDNPAGKGSGNKVTMEQIAAWNPDFIIFAPGSIYSDVAERDGWQEIHAVSTGSYIEVPEGPHNWMGSPPSVQRYLGLIWLTAELYPDYCDYDVKAEITEYYRLFYGCELSDTQYEALTANALLP